MSGYIRTLNYPLRLTLAKVAMVADKEVTVSCWFKKNDANGVQGRLVFPAQLGIAEQFDQTTGDTDEHELTLTFTPTETGVAVIEAWAYGETLT